MDNYPLHIYLPPDGLIDVDSDEVANLSNETINFFFNDVNEIPHWLILKLYNSKISDLMKIVDNEPILQKKIKPSITNHELYYAFEEIFNQNENRLLSNCPKDQLQMNSDVLSSLKFNLHITLQIMNYFIETNQKQPHEVILGFTESIIDSMIKFYDSEHHSIFMNTLNQMLPVFHDRNLITFTNNECDLDYVRSKKVRGEICALNKIAEEIESLGEKAFESKILKIYSSQLGKKPSRSTLIGQLKNKFVCYDKHSQRYHFSPPKK